MKKTLILLTILFSGSALSIELDSRWNYKFEKEVVLTCSQDEYFCEDLCENKERCIIKENVCRDCIGSTPYLTHVFNQIGRSIVSEGIEAPVEDLIELLRDGKFSSISSKSIYNHVDRFGSNKIMSKFESLCDYESQNPVMIFETQEVSKLLGKPKYLICNNNDNTKLFYLNPNGGIILNN